MPKLFTIKQFFAFLASFTITFTIGFFIFDAFINSGFILKNIAGYADQNGTKFFAASLQPDYLVQGLIPATGSENFTQQDDSQNVELADSTADSQVVLTADEAKQDLLDDIAEKIDIIKVRVLELQQESGNLPPPEQDANNQNNDDALLRARCAEETSVSFECSVLKNKENPGEIQNSNNTQKPSSKNSGVASVFYPKLLISELQISPIGQRFIELYNPNDSDVDLTGWYLQRKTQMSVSWTSSVSSTKFESKNIPAHGYFVISRSDADADIVLDITLSENNSLIFKNPNGDISDKLGFGTAQEYETMPAQNPSDGQSIGRKITSDGKEQDTDNNSADFELQTPSPKLINATFVEPPVVPVQEKDIIPPEAIFSIEPAQTILSFPINFSITDLLGTVTPSGIDNYIFQWQEEGGSWNQDSEIKIDGSPNTATATRDFTGEDGKTYYFQIKTKDSAGNESDWQPATPATTKISLPKKVLINEIQLSPISQRFIELYNPNDYAIDLTGWYIQRKTKTADSWGSCVSSTNFNGKTIMAKGYFSISKSIDGSDIILDLTLTEDNSLALKNADREIIDKIGWGLAQDYETAQALNPDDGKSITRTGGLDTDDNSKDFIISDTPTPKQ